MSETDKVMSAATEFATLIDKMRQPPVAVFTYVDGKPYRVEAKALP